MATFMLDLNKRRSSLINDCYNLQFSSCFEMYLKVYSMLQITRNESFQTLASPKLSISLSYNRSYLLAHLIHSIGSHELYFFSGIPWGTLVDLYWIITKGVILYTVRMIVFIFIYNSLMNRWYKIYSYFILMAAPWTLSNPALSPA